MDRALMLEYPKKITSLVAGRDCSAGTVLKKYNPATGDVLTEVITAEPQDVTHAVAAGAGAFEEWNAKPVFKRADILRDAALRLKALKSEIAPLLALETGRSVKNALGEVDAAVECGLFFAGEGRRFGEVLVPSTTPNREVKLIRDGVGVGALITPYNNPLAGIAWKIFPALLCGNSVVIKAHELTPYTSHLIAECLFEAGVPKEVISIVHGGKEIGETLVKNPHIAFVSFTGSSAGGAAILTATAPRLTRVSIESGGKNPFVVCDDADMARAVDVAVAAAFVDGGQRCAAASRIIIFDAVYEGFKQKFLEKVSKLRVGVGDADDYGAIISEERLKKIEESIAQAKKDGSVLLTPSGRVPSKGYFFAPAVFENVHPMSDLSQKEIFGPVVALFRVKNLEEAIALANDTPYLLSSAVHTQSVSRSMEFARRYRGGVVRINGPTHGSEPHMPFGGEGLSGNGWREPGVQALEFYASWKQVSIYLL